MENKSKKSLGKGCLMVIGVLFGIFVLLLIVGIVFESNEKSTTENQEKITVKKSTKTPEELYKEQKDQLEKEIASIEEGINFSIYHTAEDISILQIELALFALWNNIIDDGEKSDDIEIKELVTQLKSKVLIIQKKEFPILRKRYGEILNKQMWEHDILISTSGSENEYINITGGVFASNKNKQEYQNNIHETLKHFRFTQSRYRWYKGEDEYTYYTIFEGKDTDLMDLTK